MLFLAGFLPFQPYIHHLYDPYDSVRSFIHCIICHDLISTSNARKSIRAEARH